MKSVNLLQRRIEGVLKWAGLVLLGSYAVFFAVYFSLEMMHINSTASLWTGLFYNRMGEMEHMVDIRDKALPYANYFITDLDGNVKETSNEALNNIRLNRSGLFGKLADLKTNHVKIIFFPDMVDGTQRIHFAKKYSNQYAIYSFNPERFFPSFTVGKTNLMLEVDNIIWYSNNSNIIGDSHRNSVFRIQGGQLLISVKTDFPYIQNTKIVIVENITIEAAALFFSALILLGLFFLLYRRMGRNRREAEDELLRINEDLEQSIAERTEMLFSAYKELEAYSYNISHDMKAPLMAIDGYTRIFLEDHSTGMNDESKMLLTNVRKICSEMVLLVNKLLEYSKMGNAPLNIEPLELSKIIRDAFNEQSKTDRNRKAELHIENSPLPILGDRVLIKNAMTNLISNGLKFTRTREIARIWCGSREVEGETIYYIRDNGIGFDMKYSEKLFNVFQRLHDSDEYEGSGIGLAAVKRVFEKHGGRIWITSEEDEGTEVCFSIKTERILSLQKSGESNV